MKIFFIIGQLLFSLFFIEYFLPVKSFAAPLVQENTYLLPPIRRLGIETPKANIDEFRKFMRQSDRDLRGLAAQALNEGELSEELGRRLDKVVAKTGRFWTWNIAPLWNLQSKVTDRPQSYTMFKQRYTSQYSLDGWLDLTVHLSPDQTLLKLVMKSPGVAKDRERILVREDVLLEPQADYQMIEKGLEEALLRMISTLGHDGRVTSQKDDLITLDFGSERGVMRGMMLFAGYVTLVSAHPQTGEFIRSQRYAIHKMRVLETREGSSLCQIIARDNEALDLVRELTRDQMQGVVMLAWREDMTTSTYSQDAFGSGSAYENQKPYFDATAEGFAVPPPFVDNRNIMSSTADAAMQSRMTSVEEDWEQTAQKRQYSRDEGNAKDVSFDDPATWQPLSANLGAAVTFGTIAGDVSSGIAPTLLNTIFVNADFYIDSEANAQFSPQLKYSYFDSNIKGNSFTLALPARFRVFQERAQQQNGFVGLALEYTSVHATSDANTLNLSKVALLLEGLYSQRMRGVGTYNVLLGISFFDLAEALLVGQFFISVSPESLPKELSFFVGFKKYSPHFNEFSLGVAYNFLPSLLQENASQ